MIIVTDLEVVQYPYNADICFHIHALEILDIFLLLSPMYSQVFPFSIDLILRASMLALPSLQLFNLKF